jgi:hypothetical protein
MNILYPGPGTVTVQTAPGGTQFVPLNLAGNDFAILR